MGEADLIARAQRGDEAAWEALTRQHQEAAFRLAYLLLGDADEAADAAQEAFIRAYQALARFDAARPFRPWLLRITANQARNQRRSAGRYLANLQRLLRAEPERVLQAEHTAAEHAEARTLWQAVRRLSESDQQVIYLRYFLEMSEAEMAETLGVAAGTVKSRLGRGLQRLRGVIEREFPALRESFLG